MTCIKTGCYVAHAETPDHIYRVDVHQYQNMLVFRSLSNGRYLPDIKADLLIFCGTLVFEDKCGCTILAEASGVSVRTPEVYKAWLTHCPDLLSVVTLDVS